MAIDIENLPDEAKKALQQFKEFQLAEQYKDIETQSNELTTNIKNLFYQNFSDRKKIEAYSKSFQLNDDLNIHSDRE